MLNGCSCQRKRFGHRSHSGYEFRSFISIVSDAVQGIESLNTYLTPASFFKDFKNPFFPAHGKHSGFVLPRRLRQFQEFFGHLSRFPNPGIVIFIGPTDVSETSSGFHGALNPGECFHRVLEEHHPESAVCQIKLFGRVFIFLSIRFHKNSVVHGCLNSSFFCPADHRLGKIQRMNAPVRT